MSHHLVRGRLMRGNALVVGALMFVAACSDVKFVDRITFVNEGDFPANVSVSDSTRSEWLGIGIAVDNGETSYGAVIDQGETWVFRFAYGGKHHEDVGMSRSELERNDWTVTIPLEFEEALRELGLQPPL